MVHMHPEVGWYRAETLSWCCLGDLQQSRLSGLVPPLLTEEIRASTEQLEGIPRVCGAALGWKGDIFNDKRSTRPTSLP